MSEIAAPITSAATVPFATLTSEGRCVILGGDAAVEAAISLADDLTVTLVLTEPAAAPPERCIVATICGASGGFGAFRITVQPAAHERLRQSIDADIVLDLTGGRSLFAGCGNRDGYLRARPSDVASVQGAIAAARDLVGDFEKPMHVAFEPALCAHARNGITGCTRCLDICPAGAISSAGDHIEVDAGRCEGCGSCAGGCPTGALSTTMPAPAALLDGVRSSAGEGNTSALLLIYDAHEGAELADVLKARCTSPLTTLAAGSVLQLGHEVLLGLLAGGACGVAVLVPPRHRDHRGGLEAQAGIARRILEGLGHGGERIVMLDDGDPDILAERLDALTRHPVIATAPFGLAGSKREVAANILVALHEAAAAPVATIQLPKVAPYGTVVLDDQRCTLCLACVNVCPVHALQDSRDLPELKFGETACVQCGLCAATCPEQALSLSPRIDFEAVRGSTRTLKAEAPFACRACGKPFGTRSAIERVKTRLAGNPHFADASRIALVEMCGDCRVREHMRGRQPMAAAERPRVTTSEDYILAPDRLSGL